MLNKNFTLIWLGKIVSQLGDKFYALALAWWILRETGSASVMGFFLLASVLPGTLCGFFTGAFVDRRRKKSILIAADILRGGLVLSITLLAFAGSLEVWHVFVIGFCLSVSTAFFDPAVQAIIPEIVPKEQLPRANSMSQMVSGVCTVAGPLLGAFSVAFFGIAVVFLANSISYLVSAFLACFVKTDPSGHGTSGKNSLWKDVREGFRFLGNQRRIRLILIIIAAGHFFLGSLMVSLPFLARSLSGDGVKNLGYLEMMMGFGLLTGSVIIGIKKKVPIGEGALISFMTGLGLCLLSISMGKLLDLQAVYYYLAVMAAVGLCVAFASVFWQSLLQNYTPAEMRGRVFSVSSLLGNTSLPLAYGLFGVLLNVTSLFAIFAGCGLGLLIFCLCLYFSLVRSKPRRIIEEVS